MKDQISQQNFARDGYISVSPLFDEDRLTEINLHMQRLISDVVPDMPETHVYYEDKQDKKTLKQLQRIFDYDSFFHELMHKGVVRQIAESLLGDEVVPINMQYFNKPAGIGQPTPAHQDGYYFHLDPCEAVTGWLALEDVDHDTGCIHYVRGSHATNNFRPHGHTGVLGFSQGITDFGTESDVTNTVAFPCKAGAFLMHHARTIHFAGANVSPARSRRALGFIYYAARAKEDINARNAYQASLDDQLKQRNRI